MMKALAKGIHSNSTKHSPKLGYKESSSFRQNEPDLYLILGCKIFPTHKVYANRSAFISQKIQTDEKVIIIEIEIEIQLFERVLEFLYEGTLKFERNSNTEKLFLMARQLQIPQLEQACLAELKQNFQEYSFFQLYKFSIKNHIPELIERCQEELYIMEYEQINFNRADLLNLPREVFEKIIRNHQKLKANKSITGLATNEIIDAIETYSEHNQCEFKVEQLMKPEYDCFQLTDSKVETKPKIIKSQSLFVQKLNCFSRSLDNFKSCEQLANSGHKIFMKELNLLKNINEDLEKGNEIMLNQIKQLKDEILEPEQNGITFEQISRRLLSFEKMCASNSKKFLQVQNQMESIESQRQKNLSCSSQDSDDYNQRKMDEMDDLGKMEFSLQTTNPSESQVGSISFNKIPKMERDFGF